MPDESIQRFPLAWPLGWPRAKFRLSAGFSEKVENAKDGAVQRRSKPVSVATAVERLDDQIARLGGTHPTLSTNVRLNLRGIPYGNEEPYDTGAAVYFTFKGKARVFACDKWSRVADNIAAIAAHIDALRRVDRYGVGSLDQALEGYKALPADSAADWRKVLGFSAHETVSTDMVDRAFKEWSRKKHPDMGGTDEEMMHLNRAREFALAELAGA